MLVDNLMPIYDFTEVHSIIIKSSPSNVFKAIKLVSPSEMSIIFRLLFAIRSIPEKISGNRGMKFTGKKALLDQLFELGFTDLKEEKDKEVVFGTIMPVEMMKFGKTPEDLWPKIKSAAEFVDFNKSGYIMSVANLFIEDNGSGIKLTTETRTKALDEESRKVFARYWFVIRPGSALVRRLWLRAIRRRAEKAPTSSL